ncbi:ImmA/IrrE family metallo-endopeptidase [Micrococcus luteus]|nr:ImmA/IrrE family metallo-endopeptidase [Micrococcus luteus]
MTVRVAAAPDVLSWAAERAGWDDALAEKHFPRFHDWLTGTQQPTLKQLEEFAHKTHTPFGALFLPEPPRMDLPIPDLRTVGGAGVSEPSPDLLDVVHECQLRQDWYRDEALRQGEEPVALVGSATVDDDPEAVGARLRHELAIQPVQNKAGAESFRRRLVARLEGLGLLVMISGIVGGNTSRALDPQDFRGFALSDPVAPLIFVNGTDAPVAQHFTLLHETAHIVLGHSAVSGSRMRGGTGEEAWCNRVASAALVPLDEVRRARRDSAGVPLAELVEDLAARYCVSRSVIYLRLRVAGLVSEDVVSRHFEEQDADAPGRTPRRRRESGGDYYRTATVRLGKPLIRAVLRSTREGHTSYREAMRLLGTHKIEVLHEMGRQAGVE